jgi:hypothetical protein
VQLIQASLLWRQLQERAQKIQGDKKRMERMLSQRHCVSQFNRAHRILKSGPKSPQVVGAQPDAATLACSLLAGVFAHRGPVNQHLSRNHEYWTPARTERARRVTGLWDPGLFSMSAEREGR